MLRNAVGGACQIFQKNRYKGVRFNVISVTRGWVGIQFPEKKRYVTLEWHRRLRGWIIDSRVNPINLKTVSIHLSFCSWIISQENRKREAVLSYRAWYGLLSTTRLVMVLFLPRICE